MFFVKTNHVSIIGTLFFTGFICTLSSEASVATLTTITIDRYFSIIHPLSHKDKSIKKAIGIVLVIWVGAAGISALPFTKVNIFGYYYYGSNALCLPLHIHDPYALVSLLLHINGSYIIEIYRG